MTRRLYHPALSEALKQEALGVEEAVEEVAGLESLLEQVEGLYSCCRFVCLLLGSLLIYWAV